MEKEKETKEITKIHKNHINTSRKRKIRTKKEMKTKS